MVDGRNITPTMNRQSGKSFAGIALAISVPRKAVRPGFRGASPDTTDQTSQEYFLLKLKSEPIDRRLLCQPPSQVFYEGELA